MTIKLSTEDLEKIIAATVAAALKTAKPDADPLEEETLARMNKTALPRILNLSNATVVKTPLLWTPMAVKLNLTENDLENAHHTDGTFILSLRSSMKKLWPDISEGTLDRLVNLFKSIVYTYLSSGLANVDAFFNRVTLWLDEATSMIAQLDSAKLTTEYGEPAGASYLAVSA